MRCVRTIAILAIAAIFLVLAAPRAAEAQRAQPSHTVGVLLPQRLGDYGSNYASFVESMRRIGYREGGNLRTVLRSAEGKLDRLPALAAELVAAKVDVIVAVNTPGARAAIQATKQIPIVMVSVGDPVATGFVSNLARPGGNVTGVTNMVAELAPKRLALLKEAVPAAKRIAVMFNPQDPITEPQVRDAQRAAPEVRVEIRLFPIRQQGDLAEAFKLMLAWRADAALWLNGQHQGFQRKSIELATEHRLPLMVGNRHDVDAGGLISYVADNDWVFGRAAEFVDRILKGTKPGDLPVERPTKFELSLNLRTAKALGISIPGSVRLQADHTIQP
jgi:putative ABC transport system substrate-binding protein